MAWSPYKDAIIDFVTKNPGCTKMDVARHIAYAVHPSKMYAPINTAIKNKWIVSVKDGRGYKLTPSKDT